MIKDNLNLKGSLIATFSIWIIYSFLYFLFTKNDPLIAGYFSLMGQVGMDLSAAFITFYLCIKSKESNSKIVYSLFFISFVSAAFADGIYNFVINILKSKEFYHTNSTFEIPFLLFLLFQVLAWGKICVSGEKSIPNKSKYPHAPYIMIAILILFMFIFGIPWKIEYLSILGLYQITDTLLEAIGFTVVAICLARAQNNTIRFASIGYLIIISSDLMIRYNVVSGMIPFLNPFETTWILGLMLLTMGFLIEQRQTIRLLALNSLQSYIAIWLLNICLVFIFLFAIVSYTFTTNIKYDFGQVDKNLLSIIIPFSILAVIFSKILAAKISFPLENLEKIIRNFTSNAILADKSESNSILEFMVLEKFVYDAFDLQQKKRQFEMEFAEMATQVAHDIKSPLIALNNYFNEVTQINGEKADILKLSLNRINEIASNLLNRHKMLGDSVVDDNNNVNVIFPYVEWIILEKKLQFKNKPVHIDFICDELAETAFVTVNTEKFQRVISNLINNSIEAIENEGRIRINLKKQGSTIIIQINDTGCGMSNEVLKKIKQGEKLSEINGNGLGLSHAISNIKQWGADFSIESKENYGTDINIIFPIQQAPNWFLMDIYIYEGLNIVIVDDDDSIHILWKEVINKVSNNVKNINILYLKSTHELKQYVNNNSNSNNTLYLVDYHIMSSPQSGLEAIIDCAIGNYSVIVSNKYPDNHTKKVLCENNVKFNLKSFIQKTRIHTIFKKPDFILLDDMELVTKMWSIEGQRYNKKITTFNTKESLMQCIHLFDKETIIYLDSHLGDVSGEEVSKQLYDMGFKDLYLTTGYDASHFPSMPWIKGIIGKEPPYSNMNAMAI